MAMLDDPRRRESPDGEEEFSGSAFQLRLAASVVEAVVKRNGGGGIADRFWDEDSLEASDEREEYLDPELWDPDYETVPEMAYINENISECL